MMPYGRDLDPFLEEEREIASELIVSGLKEGREKENKCVRFDRAHAGVKVAKMQFHNFTRCRGG